MPFNFSITSISDSCSNLKISFCKVKQWAPRTGFLNAHCFCNWRDLFQFSCILLSQLFCIISDSFVIKHSGSFKSFTKVTSPLGSIAQVCRFKSCRAHHSEMTFGYQAAAQGAPASTAKVFLRSKSWPLTLGHDFVFEAIDLRCSSTDFVSR